MQSRGSQALPSDAQHQRPQAHAEHRELPLNFRKHFFIVSTTTSTGTASQGGYGAFILRGVRQLSGHDPGQPALGDPAGAGLAPGDLQSCLTSARSSVGSSRGTWSLLFTPGPSLGLERGDKVTGIPREHD